MGLSSLQSERIQRRRIGEGLELTFLLPSLFPSLSLAFSRSAAPFASVEDNQDQYQDGGWVNSPIKLSFTCSLRVASLTSSAPSSFAVRLPKSTTSSSRDSSWKTDLREVSNGRSSRFTDNWWVVYLLSYLDLKNQAFELTTKPRSLTFCRSLLSPSTSSNRTTLATSFHYG